MVYINYAICVEHTTRFDLTKIFAIYEWVFNKKTSKTALYLTFSKYLFLKFLSLFIGIDVTDLPEGVDPSFLAALSAFILNFRLFLLP